MDDFLPTWIAAAFSAANAVRSVFYLPQIVAVARSTSGARDIALSTWLMWAVTNALGAAYGAVVVGDRLLALSFALCLLGCVLTIALTVAQRVRWAAALRSEGRRVPHPCGVSLVTSFSTRLRSRNDGST
jgi:hypothetical protein